MTTQDIKFADISVDVSRPELDPVWEALDSPIYHVLDTDGVNIADAKVRRLDHRKYWLYVDELDGYEILTEIDVGKLILVTAENDPKLEH